MSHFTNLTTEIRDMEVCKKALKNMGLYLESMGTCRHYYGTTIKENVVKLPGRYDMALENNDNGTYCITADFYAGDVERTIGDKGCILLQNYGIEMLKKTAKKMRLSISSINKENNTFKVRDPQDPNGGYMIARFGESGEIIFEPKGIKGKNCSKFLELEEALGKIEKREFLPEYYEKGTEPIKTTSKKERLKIGEY